MICRQNETDSAATSNDWPLPLAGALLSVDEMYRADRGAIAAGTSGLVLMEAAGQAVAREIEDRWSPRSVAILCGPGNNGGDGFVIARLLRAAGWAVNLALLGDAVSLQGDAKANAERWEGEIAALSPDVLDDAELVVDALFGAGLARDITGVARETLSAIGGRPVIAVDTPSGVHGDSGAVLGYAAPAVLTVTFCRRKPGHLLLPGRALCGTVVVADIGIADKVVSEIEPRQAANTPALWHSRLPWPQLSDHKYRRGHAVVTGGRNMTGAARMAALAAQRIGAGMVSVAVPSEAEVVYKIAMTTVLVRAFLDTHVFREFIDEPRVSACLVGPGNEVVGGTRERALAALRTGKPVVLDADAISVFEPGPELLFETVQGPCVMTPHDGEFARVFAVDGDKVARSRRAAEQSGAIIVLKGADTVIAAPDGRAVINENAPPTLATGGAGDVLAGFIVGLLAQGMEAFDAACAAVWIHGDAASRFGPGLVADDLIDTVPSVLRALKYENEEE